MATIDLGATRRAKYNAKFSSESNVSNLLSAWTAGLTPIRHVTAERVGVMPVYAPGAQETGAAAARRLQQIAPDVFQARLNELRTKNRKASVKSLTTIATIAVGGYFAGSAMAAGNAASVGTTAAATTSAPVANSAGIGLTAQAGLPAYQTQLAAAAASKSAITASSVGATVKAGVSALSSVAAGVSSVAGLVTQLKGAGSSGNAAPVEQFGPAPVSVNAPGDSPDISIDTGGGSDLGAFLPVAIFGLAAVLLLKGK